jgi:hypothetical protein
MGGTQSQRTFASIGVEHARIWLVYIQAEKAGDATVLAQALTLQNQNVAVCCQELHARVKLLPSSIFVSRFQHSSDTEMLLYRLPKEAFAELGSCHDNMTSNIQLVFPRNTQPWKYLWAQQYNAMLDVVSALLNNKAVTGEQQEACVEAARNLGQAFDNLLPGDANLQAKIQ